MSEGGPYSTPYLGGSVRSRILEQLKKLEEVLIKLKEKESIKLEEYRQDTDAQWITERGLEIGASTILDIGNHILAGAYQTPVEEYEQILEKLHEKRVISKSLYENLRGLGGFRNILVHGYLSLNLASIRALQEGFGLLPQLYCRDREMA